MVHVLSLMLVRFFFADCFLLSTKKLDLKIVIFLIFHSGVGEVIKINCLFIME
jgi:hypothetical protein